MKRVRHFFGELQRRHVLRVLGADAVAAWIAVEVYRTVQPLREEPRFRTIPSQVGIAVPA